MVSLVWGYRKEPELTIKQQTSPPICLLVPSNSTIKSCVPLTSLCYPPNLLLLLYFQSLFSFKKKFIYLLFIWLGRVLVAAHRIFVVARAPERTGLVAPRYVGS